MTSLSPRTHTGNGTSALQITTRELRELFAIKHGPAETWGWAPRRRRAFGYYQPVDYYEALVTKLVTEKTDWIDVGGGDAIFPHSDVHAQLVSERARRLVGVDPSGNILNNTFVHERIQCTIEDYQTEHQFDLVTLRMVAEHITDPNAVVQALNRLLRPGGMAVIFTVNLWSVVTMISRIVPFPLHYPIKRLFWGGDEKDTFPTTYKMNTRRHLGSLFGDGGFAERYFAYLDDLCVFRHFKPLNYLELVTWRTLKQLHTRYPENCLLVVYEKTDDIS